MLEKSVSVDAMEINYKITGEGSPLLILHGWGSSSDSWIEVQRILAEKEYQVIVPDLPGFGKTQAPAIVWGVEEYAEFAYTLMQQLGFEKCILAGHSFGGQIAIQFAVTHPEHIEKLILISAAGVRRTPGVAKKLVMAVAKLVSFVLYLIPFADLRANIKNALYMLVRRRDYAKTQGIMREVFKKVITQDFTAKFSRIKTPTFIIWGDKDELTPVQDAYLMKELIPNSKLEVIEKGKHGLNLEIPEKLAEIIVAFLKR